MIGYLRARHAAKRAQREYEAARLLTLLEAIRADGARLAEMSSVHVTVPASKSMRAGVLADFRKAHGLDLSDDDRAAAIRAKRS